MSKNDRSDIEEVVKTTKKLYSEVRRLEREVNKVSRLIQMFGMAVPGLTMLGPYGFVVAMVFQVATMVAQEITRNEIRMAERRRERERIEARRELINEIKSELESGRRESFRSMIPG